MNKQKLNKILDVIKYGAMILFIFFLGYVIYFEPNNFCVTVEGLDYQVDLVDRGQRCFKTIGESNEFKLYLIDKYDIGKENDLFLSNLSIN